MSARNAMHGPVFSPFMTATVLVPEILPSAGRPGHSRVLRMSSGSVCLLKGELRILMHVAPPGDYIRLKRQDLF